MFKAFKIFLIFISSLIILFIALLFNGIKIDSFSFGNLFVSQFYIKMDKKLILNIKKMEFETKSSKVNNSYEDLKRDIKYLPRILYIFEKIDIEEINVNNNNFSMIYEDDFIYLDNKFINIASKIDVVSNQVIFDLYSLYLKDLDVVFDGKLKIDYFKENISFYGNYFYGNLVGNLNLDLTSKLGKFYITSNPFPNLKFLKKFITLPPVAESWMYDNVVGEMKLDNLYGEIDFENKKLLEETLVGKAQISKASIKFHEKLEPILTKSIDVTFEKDRLSFYLNEPKYITADITGSSVVINNLTSKEKGEVVVSIKTNSILDKNILNILKAYGITLPVLQKDGEMNGSLEMIFPYLADKKMSVKGQFLAKNSNIFINQFGFFTKEANVYLDDSLVKIVESDFKFKDIVDAKINLDLDTKTLIGKGEADIKTITINKNKKEKIVNINDLKTALNMDFSKNMRIVLDSLNIEITNENGVVVNLKDLSKIYPYSNLLKDYNIKSGELALFIKDENNIELKAKLKDIPNIPLQREDGININSLDINGSIKNKNLKLTTVQDDISFYLDAKNNMILELKDLIFLVPENINDNKKTKIPNLKFSGTNFKIKTDEETVYDFVTLNANLNPTKSFFDGKLAVLDLPISKNGEKVKNLELSGTFKDDVLLISSEDNGIILKLKNKNIDLDLKGYDIEHSTEKKEGEEEKKDERNININGINSNLIINNKYKFLAENYEINLNKDTKYVNLNYKKTNFSYKKSLNGKIDIFADNVDDKFINSIFGKKIFDGGSFLLLANGFENDLNGKFIIKNTKVEDLAVLNNLLLFIHSSPALINPLLAVPSVVGMATNGGFTLTGYQIVDGFLEFNYNDSKEFMKINKLVTKGNGIDFNGFGTFDVNSKNLDTKIKLIFLKDYSKIVGAIPILNYILLGDNKRVETEVNLFGDISNPKISTNLTKDTFSVPVNIAKRVLSSPAKLLEFVEELNKSQNKIDNKPMLETK